MREEVHHPFIHIYKNNLIEKQGQVTFLPDGVEILWFDWVSGAENGSSHYSYGEFSEMEKEFYPTDEDMREAYRGEQQLIKEGVL